jgi:dihydroorotase
MALAFVNASLVNEGRIVATDVLVRGDRIERVGPGPVPADAEVVDLAGKHLLPGLIDDQVHCREPGLTHKATLASESLAAVCGGVTSFLDMPNTSPPTTDRAALAAKKRIAAETCHANYGFYLGATHTNIEEIRRASPEDACGIKVFMGASTGTLLVQDDEGIEQVLRHVNRRAAFHSEDEYRLADRRPLARTGDWTSHYEVRDAQSAIQSTERLVRIATALGKRIHVLHVTTADEIAYLAAHKDVASVELTPQHLTLAGPEAYERLKGYAQMNPPIRGEEHRAALWAGLASGVADVLGSDHAPHTSEEKARPYPASPSGMPGVQTLLPVMLTHVAEGRLTLERLVDLTSHGANRLFGLADKGRMAEGFDADLTIVDLKARRTIAHADMASRVGWTPFDGMQAKGWPMATIIRGRIVMRDDEVIAPHLGEPVRFAETLAG